MVIKPNNVDDHFEQLRPPIVRATGSTPSERYLAELAERSFLNLWSYPNPHRSQKLGGAGDGKELCDLLVVCDPHVIVFSEKEIRWTDKAVDVAWPRWFRKAVDAAATQLRGAERWINEFPDRIFLDPSCETPFPLEFPPAERRRLHRVVVARGAAAACKKHFGGGMGTLVVKPDLKGAAHVDASSASFFPFAIGDIDPESDFVHVFDEVALDIVMQELDTITDFTDYLDKRARFLRSGNLEMAGGEEDLLAFYAIRINDDGDHDFTPPDGHTWKEAGPVRIGAGNFAKYVSNPQYQAKKAADEVSYIWDSLIETFTEHMLNGTSIVLPGFRFSLTESEIAVRHMALRGRYMRRSHGKAIMGALEIGQRQQVFFRAMLAARTSRFNETGFFFMTLKYMDWMEEKGGYEHYRLFRSHYLQTYAQALLMKFDYLQRVIGIAMEPPNQGRGASEDIIYGEQQAWTPEQRAENKKDAERLGIMQSLVERPVRSTEFPEIAERPRRGPPPPRGNRKQRRAMAAKARKQER